MLYAEQDLHDTERQATAFGTLRAIMNRKLVVPEMDAVMNKVMLLIVTSENDNVRQQSRAVIFTYISDYLGPYKKKAEEQIKFLLKQLDYELAPGRMSVIKIMHSIITGFKVVSTMLMIQKFF